MKVNKCVWELLLLEVRQEVQKNTEQRELQRGPLHGGGLPNQPCSETKRPWMGRELHFQRVRKEPMKWKMMTWTGL